MREQILGEHLNAAAAWQAAVEEMAARFRAIDDNYMRARAADVLDVGRRVLGHLTSVSLAMPEFREPSILIAGDLSPSDTAEMDADMVLGIITERGGAMAHSAILARAFGIPAVVGAGPLLSQVVDGQMRLDGSSGGSGRRRTRNGGNSRSSSANGRSASGGRVKPDSSRAARPTGTAWTWSPTLAARATCPQPSPSAPKGWASSAPSSCS